MSVATDAILTNSINTTEGTGNIDIATTQTSGALNIGTNAGRTATGIINIGSTTSLAPIKIETASTKNTYEDPAIAIGTTVGARAIRIGNASTLVSIGNLSIQGIFINNRTSTNNLNISNSQISGILNIATANSRSGAINIGTGTTTTSSINIHNGSSSSGSVNIANGSQTTTVNIQSGTGTGTVTIGNAASSVALNGAVTLASPLSLGTGPTLATQLGFRTTSLITVTNYTAVTVNTQVNAKSFTFPAAGVWIVELRLRTNTISNTEVSLSTTSNTLSVDRLSRVNNTAAGQSTFLTTTIVEPSSSQTWYVVVRSSVVNTVFTEFYLFASRIG